MQNIKNIQIALKKIQQVRKEKSTFLDLSGLMLEDLPDDISDLKFLLEIDLSYNHLTMIPKSISKLDNLFYLNVSNNFISEIDFEIGRYYCLVELNISYNSLISIPNSLVLLQNTNILYQNNPFLNDLPFEMEYYTFDDIRHYLELINDDREVHRFYETKLIFVGSGEVGKTTLMKVLKDHELDIIVGDEPTTHGINIDSLEYDVYFPAHPPFYNSFKDMEDVYLKDVDFYEDEDEEEEIYANHDEQEYYSIGEILGDIDSEQRGELMITRDLTHMFSNAVIEKQIKINLWDFGGQEIYYSTHQFFLTKRSIYLFVWEPRKDNDDEDFDYWLNTIKLLSADSPVIVVMNKSDIRHKNIDEKNYRNKFKNISKFLAVSCVTKIGINELNNEIKKCIVNLPHMGNKIPESWIRARQEIKKIKKNYISYTEFIHLCGEEQLISDRKELAIFSDYLHDLGDIIHFKEDSILKNIVIINPQWATKAVYALIDTIEIQRNNGIFKMSELESYWDIKHYPIEKHIELLQLMEKFEICFKLVGAKNTYVIPELLRTEIPNSTYVDQIQNDNPLKFQIHYKFMPFGLTTRLICRLYDMIFKDNYWKNGAIFFDELSKAVLIGNRINRTITILVSGKQKSNLLAIIRGELRKIHSDFNMTVENDFTEKLPCICDICKNEKEPFFFEYEVLKKYLSKDKRTIVCNKSVESVEIIELISGYRNIKPNKKILHEILSAVSQLQGHNQIINKNEDARNLFIAARLSQNGIVAKDQSNWGSSGSGKSQGRLDIKIEDNEGNIMTIFEGVNLKTLDKTNLNNHIDKIIHRYDANGIPEKFIGVYFDGNDFDHFGKKYFDYLLEYNFSNTKFEDTKDETKNLTQHSEIRIFKTSYLKSSIIINLNHILINMKP